MSQTQVQLVGNVVTGAVFAGIVTSTSASIGYDSVGINSSGINVVGVVTASSFVGDVTGTASTATAAGIAYGLEGTPNINVGFATISGVDFSNILSESVNIVAGKLSDNSNINLDNGMIHYFTTTETTTSTPNIVSGVGINTALSIGDSIAVTIGISTGSYAARISIDGNLSGITTYWSGGTAPDAAGDSGKDIYSYQIIKTASATYDVFASVTNFA